MKPPKNFCCCAYRNGELISTMITVVARTAIEEITKCYSLPCWIPLSTMMCHLPLKLLKVRGGKLKLGVDCDPTDPL